MRGGVLAGTAALLLGGCTVGPNFSPPHWANPVSWFSGQPRVEHPEQSEAVAAPIDVDWWNLFHDPEGELGLSALAYHFLGGVLAHAEPLAALFTPTVNSFKRINAGPTVSGATWSPNAISYGGNNRTHMVRIPEPGRFELRDQRNRHTELLRKRSYSSSNRH